ncbi:unnamed protein product [marine sediment metagenome]|uniref:Uncharacterized protein n=1 Tax=marine sediment metagenome TaxID=412755 RepID=X0S4M4_9ZZZZ
METTVHIQEDETLTSRVKTLTTEEGRTFNTVRLSVVEKDSTKTRAEFTFYCSPAQLNDVVENIKAGLV